MNPTTLDLDASSSYANEYRQILYNEDVWPVLEDDFNGTNKMLQELLNNPADIRNPFLKDLQRKCDEVFRKNYTHVLAYHACRTVDPDAYRRLGLLTSSKERLEAKAKEIFAGLENLERALSEAEVYFRLYDESISMYISAEFASTEYLTGGSHYLRMVAANLGSKAEERLLHEHARGKPVFVKCKIGVSWLEDPAIVKECAWLYRYNASLIRRFIWARAKSGERYEEIPQTLVVFKAIPPEDIEAILNPEVCTNWIG